MLKMVLSCSSFAFFVTLYLNHLLQPVAKRLGLIDKPGGRKQHLQETPLIGGLALFLGFAFAILTLPISLANYRSLLAGGALLMLVGILDDLHEIPPYSRLIGQAIASFLMVCWGGNFIPSLENMLGIGTLTLGPIAIPFTIFIVIAAINAMNMLDGLDGLLGSISFIILTTLLLINIHVVNQEMIFIVALLLAAILGFLIYNFPFKSEQTAKIFLGDSGSMFLGFFIIGLIIMMNNPSNNTHINVSQILWILAIPIFDIINVTLYRLLMKKNPLHASRHHTHHLLQYIGYSSRETLWIIIICMLLTNGVALLSVWNQLGEAMLFYTFALLFLISSLFFQLTWRRSGCALDYVSEQ